ncbi:class I adenylate-forming enzyme family protein [Streptomyces qinzhouensis]|uniref:Acyl--CoA ligase n=1 Tax=Streptomyces qinzhouensis TaxID=2599401 RepID=A0A5B8IF90_9ACTN|nr:class I adenylate-forming enzyme family protein [Streptomyces qinzhouensis]QDY77258.1 acyl--CoA ligase [Streptomyces qinzhouensis]
MSVRGEGLVGPGGPFEVVRGEDGRLEYLNAPRTLVEFVEATWAHGDRPFLVGEDRTWSYREFFAAATALARRFTAEYGLRPGERAAVLMRNRPEWQVAFWAAQFAGLVAVPLNSWWTEGELAYVLEDCTPSVVLVDGETLSAVRSPARRGGARVVVFRGRAEEGVERYEDFPAPDPHGAPPAVEVRPEDDATIIYTSGTTGRPKGAVATHLAQAGAAVHPRFHAAVGALARGQVPGTGPAPVALMTYPFFHVAAFTHLYAVMAAGGTIVLMRAWDADTAVELIDRHRVTHWSGVPATALQLLDAAERAGNPLATLVQLSTGGAAPPPVLPARLAERYGTRVEPRTGYGLTETSGGVLAHAGDAYRADPAAAGIPAPAVEVRTDERGELLLRGQSLVRGYWRDEAATAAAFTPDGWFRTGDLATVGDDGRIAVVDRIKDIVIRGGENVYCAEVEGVLHGHPAVADAAVVGVPHPVLGEEVAAVVRLRPGAEATGGQLREYAGARLAAYKVPAHVVFGDVPRGATGKIAKRELRESVAGRGQERVTRTV